MSETTSLIIVLIVSALGWVGIIFGIFQFKAYADGCSLFTALKDFESFKGPLPENQMRCLDFDHTKNPNWHVTYASKSSRIRTIKWAEINEGLLFITRFKEAKLIPWSKVQIVRISASDKVTKLKIQIEGTDVRLFIRLLKADFESSFTLKKLVSTDPDPNAAGIQEKRQMIFRVFDKAIPIIVFSSFIGTLFSIYFALR